MYCGVLCHVKDTCTHFGFRAYSAALPVPSLEFALLCLQNAMWLLPDDPSETSTELSTEDDSSKYVCIIYSDID